MLCFPDNAKLNQGSIFHIKVKESKRMTGCQDNTTRDHTGDNLSSTFEDVGKDLSLERESNEAEYESDGELVHCHRLEGQSQHKLEEMVDNVPDLKGHATSGSESVVVPKSCVAVEDFPLPYGASFSEEGKATASSSKEATIAISKNLPPATTSFTRDQIISKNCALGYSKYEYL